MKPPSHHEIEVKLRVGHLAALRRQLARLKMHPAPGGRVHEGNTLFDTPQGGLAKHGQLLRIRRTAPPSKEEEAGAVFTYKGPAAKGFDTAQNRRYKVREEVELSVTDPQALQLILERLGLRGWFRYEKYRTRYQVPRGLRVTGLRVELDETPIGAFLELEGSPEAIDRVAGLLGYRPGDYITKSYLALYLEHRRKQGAPAGDMLFTPQKK